MNCITCRYDTKYDENNKTVCVDSCAKGFVKDSLLHTCIDIDECNRKDPIVVYKDDEKKAKTYEWKKCDSKNSICLNRIGSYECKCLAGFKGDGFICEDIDECIEYQDSNNVCGFNSTCVNKIGSYECVCHLGFQKNSYNQCHGISSSKTVFLIIYTNIVLKI